MATKPPPHRCRPFRAATVPPLVIVTFDHAPRSIFVTRAARRRFAAGDVYLELPATRAGAVSALTMVAGDAFGARPEGRP